VSGTENGDEEHAASLVGLAQSLLRLCDSVQLPDGAPLRLQLSLHTGAVVSGLVGNLNLKYG
jgi:class 3 adenylate cyclase